MTECSTNIYVYGKKNKAVGEQLFCNVLGRCHKMFWVDEAMFWVDATQFPCSVFNCRIITDKPP